MDYKVELKPRYSSESDFPYNPFLIDLFNQGKQDYISQIEAMLGFNEELQYITLNKIDEENPYWLNGFFPGLDVIALYSLIRQFKPKTYLEIGSGNSTKIAAKAIREGNQNTQIISIDPFPRTEIDHLADVVKREPVENLNYTNPIFQSLKKGDILFIDSSHRILPNSDCSFIYNELIPSLPSGIIIHIHDIYLPFDYPQFMCDRLYNENQVLATYLLSNPDYFKILLPNYFCYRELKFEEILSPIFKTPMMTKVEKHGGSIWLLKN